MYNPNQFDPRFSASEKDTMAVVTYDDLIAVHEQYISDALDFEDKYNALQRRGLV